MLDITNDITTWVKCCQEVWSLWFIDRENGEDEFFEVEEALFSALVLSNLNLTHKPTIKKSYGLLKGVYRFDINSERSVCKQHKTGNINCQSKQVTYKKEDKLDIQSIDFMGRMLDNKPYVELRISDQEFILEPLVNLEIKWVGKEMCESGSETNKNSSLI